MAGDGNEPCQLPSPEQHLANPAGLSTCWRIAASQDCPQVSLGTIQYMLTKVAAVTRAAIAGNGPPSSFTLRRCERRSADRLRNACSSLGI
jgi:hypothetical protein